MEHSLRSFARAHGWALSSVQRAIRSGRLRESVGRDGRGRWLILDPAKALAEWEAHSRPRVDSRKPGPPAPARGLPCSVAAFARWLGVTTKAVREAAKAGRLGPESATRDQQGRLLILDAARARAEWDPARAGKAGREIAPPSALAAATLRERLARAEAFELETARKRRLLVPAADVEARWAAIGIRIRTTLLGLPTRARQRLPHLGAKDLVVLEGLVRELLEELAAGPEAEPTP